MHHRSPRVAYFPDSFHEVNGVAHTSRNFVAYTQRHALPFLCVRAGTDAGERTEGALSTLELPRSAVAVGMEKDLAFDPLFFRHAEAIEDALHRFQPDLIHLTGPSELGMFGAYFAWKLGLPLAASWHTNVHEYAARRLGFLLDYLPGAAAVRSAATVEGTTLAATTRFYRLAQVLFAPNLQLCGMLEHATGLPCHLMQRGVDTALFHPQAGAELKTTAETSGSLAVPADEKGIGNGKPFILGYVGRLSVEKNVALLPRVGRELAARGIAAQFLIVGHGEEEAALRRELPTARFAGVLRSAALSAAYASMDLFVFPSHTDTFGNVVLEALASGVPAIVTPDGGPASVVQPGKTGSIAPDAGFASAIADLLAGPAHLARMRAAARAYALTCSWDAVFDRVYHAYKDILPAGPQSEAPAQEHPLAARTY